MKKFLLLLLLAAISATEAGNNSFKIKPMSTGYTGKFLEQSYLCRGNQIQGCHLSRRSGGYCSARSLGPGKGNSTFH